VSETLLSLDGLGYVHSEMKITHIDE